MGTPDGSSRTGPALSVANLHAAYGVHLVLRGVSAEFHAGRVVAIVGGNGAGKSTLIRIMAGVQRASAGAMCLDGRVFDPRGPADARRVGIVTLHQEGSLIEDWPVFEHFREEERGLGLLDDSEAVDRATAALRAFDVDMDVRSPVRDATPFQRQMIEIARIRARRARVVLLDEPTAGLDRRTRAALFSTIRGLCEAGCAVVLVSHDLPAVLRHADEVVVLRDGVLSAAQRAAQWNVVDLRRHLGDPTAGRVEAPQFGRREFSASAVALEFAWRSVDGESYTLSVGRGEVVGIRGDVRSDASSLLRAIVGIGGPSGRLAVLGKLAGASIESRLAMGIRYVSRERQTEWSFARRTVRENLVLGVLAASRPFSVVRRDVEARVADELRRRFSVQAESLEQEIQTLSGGNQQKVALARTAATRPAVLLVDEPFSGVDSSARALLIEEIRSLAAGGASVVAYSQESEPLERLCDRVVDLSVNAGEPSALEDA